VRRGSGGDSEVVRTYLIVSAIDYFADMVLTVTSVLLLASRLGGQGVFLTIAGVWIVEGLSELPTGVIADAIGRRASVTISFALRAAGYSALFFSASPWIAVLGTLIAANGGTWGSGALDAWAVDELSDRSPGTLDRLFLHGRIFENIGLIVGTMTGAAIGLSDLALPQVVAGAACAAAIVPCAFFMTERAALNVDRAGRRDGSGLDGRALSRRIVASGHEVFASAQRTLRGDLVLIGLVLGTALLWLFRGIPGVQWTVHFDSITGGSLLLLGLMRSTSSLLEIPLLAWMMRLQQRGRNVRKLSIISAGAAGAVLLATAAWVHSPVGGIVAYVCFSLAFGLCLPGVRAALNERLHPEHRATVLSMASMCNSLFTGAGLLIVGSTAASLSDVRIPWTAAAIGFGLCTAGVGVLAGLYRTRPLADVPADPDLAGVVAVAGPALDGMDPAPGRSRVALAPTLAVETAIPGVLAEPIPESQK
jgi:MFS family permease